MKSKKGRLAAWALAVAGIAVVVTLLFALRGRLREGAEDLFDEPFQLPVASASHGKVFISSGPIPLGEFGAFIGDYTGLPVIIDPEIAKEDVMVASDIPQADVEIVRALLRENGFKLKQETLPGGKSILTVKRLAAAH